VRFALDGLKRWFYGNLSESEENMPLDLLQGAPCESGSDLILRWLRAGTLVQNSKIHHAITAESLADHS